MITQELIYIITMCDCEKGTFKCPACKGKYCYGCQYPTYVDGTIYCHDCSWKAKYEAQRAKSGKKKRNSWSDDSSEEINGCDIYGHVDIFEVVRVIKCHPEWSQDEIMNYLDGVCRDVV